MERLVLEVGGIALIAGLSFAVSNFYKVSPLDKSWSHQNNNLAFVLLPTTIYLGFRAYLGISLFLLQKFVPPSLRVVERIISALAFVAGVYGAFKFIPGATDATSLLYYQVVGNIPQIVFDAGKGNIDKAKEFSYKIAFLIGGWFALFFTVELSLRIVLTVLVALFGKQTKLVRRVKKSSTATTGTKDTTEEVEEEEDEEVHAAATTGTRTVSSSTVRSGAKATTTSPGS